jgi:HAD superfamily hydrolase (TIGR01459 family)
MSLLVPARFADIAPAYDVLLCDIWGVVHNGRAPYPGVIAALTAFRKSGGTVILISNVPKPRDPIPGQLARLGVSDACFDAVVTSGDAIRAELAVRAPGPYVRIGPPDDDSLWSGLNLRETDRWDEAQFVAMSGLDDPLTEHPDAYRARLAPAAARGLPLLCANPDRVVRVGSRLIWCAGAVADVYAAMGGAVVLAGKPHAPIYRLAFEDLAQLRPGFERARILCVGDGVSTDVLGANRERLDCLFIASGVHGEGLRDGNMLNLEKIQATLDEDGAHARYVMAALA